jgi:hypothetical protein
MQIYCTMLGFLIRAGPQLYRVTPLKMPGRIVTSIISIPITRNYMHSQLFHTLLHMYTAYNHLYVRNCNHLFHCYTFTQFGSTTLQSLLHYST